MVSVGLAFLVCIVGLLFYIFAANLKVSEVGRIAFAMGLLAFLLQASQAIGLVVN